MGLIGSAATDNERVGDSSVIVNRFNRMATKSTWERTNEHNVCFNKLSNVGVDLLELWSSLYDDIYI